MPTRRTVLLPVTLMVALARLPAPGPAGSEALPDLDVDARRVELAGAQAFDVVTVRNGGELVVAPYQGSAGGGRLDLSARRVEVDAQSGISADGAGWRGRVAAKGEGPGGGEGGAADLFTASLRLLHPTGSGAGGGYGGRGGDGIHLDERGEWQGGRPYGLPNDPIVDLGSAGGGPVRSHHEAVNLPGGNGGGAITLRAEELVVHGRISADGAPGPAGEFDSGGGGAGGGILLQAQRLTLSGIVSARGGRGGESQDVGGHGGGGRIKVFYQHGAVDPARFDLRPGRGPCPGPAARSPSGCEGSLYIERLPTPSTVYLPRLDSRVCAVPDRRAIVVVVDASESMAAAKPGGSPLDLSLGAVDQLLDLLSPTDRVALVSFNSRAVLRQALTSERALLRQALREVHPAQGSRVDEGLALAVSALGAARPSELAEFVVLSDGQWDSTAAASAEATAATLRRHGAVGYALGIGADADTAALGRLAGDASKVWLVPEGEDLLRPLAAIVESAPCYGQGP